MLRRLAPYMSKYKIYAILCPILMILEVSVDIIIPYLMSFVVDTGIANRDISYILRIGLLMIGFALFGMTTGIISTHLGAKAGYGFAAEVRADAYRSVPLAKFDRLAQLTHVELVSLPSGTGVEQIKPWRGERPLIVLPAGVDQSSGAFMDTAAIMCSLDLVITSDTAIAHLAGALGVPTWIALGYIPDWRCLLARDDSPWYPSVRLFRQPSMGDWESVFNAICQELRTLNSPDSN